jgi:hypothetical protein
VDQPSHQLALQEFLLPDERILWTGRPDPRRLFSTADVFYVPFSLLRGGFALFWEGAVIASGAQWLFVLWGLPFVIAGQYLIWGRLIYRRWARSRTTYSVTTRRAIVLRGRSIQSVFRNQLPGTHLSVRRDGGGTIEFGSMPFRYRSYVDTGFDWLYGHARPVAFYDIPDVNNVYRLVAAGPEMS